jgi:VWA domain-containing protein
MQQRGRSLRFFLLVVAVALGGEAQPAWFIRGDVDGSGGRNIVDPLLILRALFAADQVQLGCLEAADVDDNGRIEITDAVALLQYLFVNGPQPWPEPLLQGCWIDETADSLGCEWAPTCSPRGVFYVCDKSDSMAEGGEFQKMIAEVTKAISQLSEEDQFMLIFIDANMTKFPFNGKPGNATSGVKSAAISYMTSTSAGRGSCPKPGLAWALSLAEDSTAREKTILFLTDGLTACPGNDESTYESEILTEVKARNTAGVRIDVIGVGSDQNRNDGWLQQLAEENGGTFAVLE